MAGRYPTRPERLAEERRAQRRQEREQPVGLNPDFPYRAIAFPAAALKARPIWSQVRPPEN